MVGAEIQSSLRVALISIEISRLKLRVIVHHLLRLGQPVRRRRLDHEALRLAVLLHDLLLARSGASASTCQCGFPAGLSHYVSVRAAIGCTYDGSAARHGRPLRRLLLRADFELEDEVGAGRLLHRAALCKELA